MPTITYTVAGGEMLSQKKGGADYDYLPNPLGSVKRTIATGQSLRQQYLYSPWGESDPVADDENASTPFQFIGAYGGRQQDVAGVYFRARTYSPTYARWINVDRLWPAQYAYLYCRASPATEIDSVGLAPSLPDCWTKSFAVHKGINECWVRKSPTGDGYDIYAYQYVSYDCIFQCRHIIERPPCGCLWPIQPDIVQFYRGFDHFWPNWRPIPDWIFDDSQACTGAHLIDLKKCLYEMRGMDAPGSIRKTGDVIQECGPPRTWRHPPTFMHFDYLPVESYREFQSCCGDPPPNRWDTGCWGITQMWKYRFRVLPSHVPPGGAWGKCDIS